VVVAVVVVATTEACRKIEELCNTFLKIIKQCIIVRTVLDSKSH
jgi:hypothetical protein